MTGPRSGLLCQTLVDPVAFGAAPPPESGAIGLRWVREGSFFSSP